MPRFSRRSLVPSVPINFVLPFRLNTSTQQQIKRAIASINPQNTSVQHAHFYLGVHIWQTHVEEADHLRHHQDVKPIYAKRKETIERVFADAKEKHGMRWTTLRGLKKLSIQAMLTFAAINLK
ncbi:transposase, partial [Peribacillus simplex]|uniref:transposase n=1 Tax=Peribacillus simplex TaxID=1478 RepID=UPI002989F615